MFNKYNVAIEDTARRFYLEYLQWNSSVFDVLAHWITFQQPRPPALRIGAGSREPAFEQNLEQSS